MHLISQLLIGNECLFKLSPEHDDLVVVTTVFTVLLTMPFVGIVKNVCLWRPSKLLARTPEHFSFCVTGSFRNMSVGSDESSRSTTGSH